jgi:hypothetical protein
VEAELIGWPCWPEQSAWTQPIFGKHFAIFVICLNSFDAVLPAVLAKITGALRMNFVEPAML